jgi:outer membrane immunogenic protein
LIRKLLASASLVVLSSTAVLAADLPAHYAKAPVMAAPVFNWTGCYVGVHGGGGAMHDSSLDSSGYTLNQNGNGGLAGGQAGCNYQDGNWVFGVEGEGYWSGIKSTSSISDSGGYSDVFTAKNKNDFSIAARAGVTFDRTLVYGKAGWVWGRFDFNETYIADSVSVPELYSRSGTLDGLLLGVGIEHALTQNWTVKLEYNFLKFGAKEMAETFCEASNCSPNGSSSSSATKQIFKVGANYLFNWGSAPLLAKN